MISRKIKLLAAAAGLVALAATVGLASTVHTQTTSAQRTQGTGSKAIAVPPSQNASPWHGNLTCGTAATATDCEKIETLLPMSARSWAEPLRLPSDI